MDYRIVEKPAFNVIGKTLLVSTKDGENMRRIPQFWEECQRDGTIDRLISLAQDGGVLNGTYLGLCMDFAADMSEFTYMIAVEGTGSGLPAGMVQRGIPALNWAVFPAIGAIPQAIQQLWSAIWSDFFPNEPYVHAAGPDIEVYPRGDVSQPDFRFEVCVPVVNK